MTKVAVNKCALQNKKHTCKIAGNLVSLVWGRLFIILCLWTIEKLPVRKGFLFCRLFRVKVFGMTGNLPPALPPPLPRALSPLRLPTARAGRGRTGHARRRPARSEGNPRPANQVLASGGSTTGGGERGKGGKRLPGLSTCPPCRNGFAWHDSVSTVAFKFQAHHLFHIFRFDVREFGLGTTWQVFRS